MKACFYVVLLLACFSAVSLPIQIGMPLGDSALRQQLQQLLAAAYQELGYQTEFIPLPSERRLLLLTQGLLDADLFRICELDDAYPQLRVVPAPLGSVQLNAYSLSPGTLINWQAQQGLLISHIHGFKMAELQQFSGKRVTVNSDQQAFGLMLQGRVDIVLEDSHSAAPMLDHYAVKGISWQQVANFEVCHVLNSAKDHLTAPLQLQLQLLL